MAMPAPIRSATSPRPAPAARATAPGCARVRCTCRTSPRSASALPARPRAGGMPPNLERVRRARRAMGLWRRDLARQGHALRPLGDRRRAGRFRLGLFPERRAGVPARAHERAHRRGATPRHPRRPPRLRHRDPRRARRRAHPHGQADLLHLGRQRVPDRGARGGVRPRAPVRGLPRRAPLVRSATASAASSRGRSSARARPASPARRTARTSRPRRPPTPSSTSRRRPAAPS